MPSLDLRRPLVLLDLDGTLLDSGLGIMTAAATAFEELGLPVPSEGALRHFVGPPISRSMAENGVTPELLPAAIRAYRRAAEVLAPAVTRAYDGIVDALASLRTAGVTLVVATSKPRVYASPLCNEYGFAPYLDGVHGAPPDGLTTTKGQVIGEALAHHGWPSDRDAEHTVMVGDRHYDVTGAAEHGLRCLGVGWGYAEPGELEAAGAIGVVDAVDEFASACLALIR